MRPLAEASLAELQSLLRGVSRSFYLSIRLLPAPLRRPVAVAYLLARAADTLADAPGLPGPARLAGLQALAAAIDQGSAGPATLRQTIAGPGGTAMDGDEQRLLAALPRCLEWLDTLPAEDQHDVRTVLRHITHGQALDLQRFGEPQAPAGAVRALASAGELEQYTYLVAGCVGEFWTDLCFRHVPGFSTLPAADLRKLGREYGTGLQLVNILRDCGSDLSQGRCYLPGDELAAAGLAPGDLRSNPRRLAPVWMRWHARALERMDAGLRYALAVNSPRIRAAGVLPALLGARTLALLQAAGPGALDRRVKVPRSEVRATLGRMAVTLARREPLERHYRRLREAPVNGWDNRAR